MRDADHDLAAVAVLVVASALALWSFRDAGISWDEAVHLEYGRLIHEYFASGGVDRRALGYRLDYLYGGSFDLVGAVFCDLAAPVLDPYDAIHLLGTVVGVAGLWGTWRLGRALGGPRAGLLAAGFITATAVYWGHMANNPKDLPFAAAYVWAMVFLIAAIRSFPRIPLSVAAGLAVSSGLALGVRIAGLLLPCYLGGAIAVWLAVQLRLRADAESVYRDGRRLLATGLGVAAGAWAVMLAAWPWAQQAPLTRPLAALRRMSEFMGHRRVMRFAGEPLSTYDVDWRYLPHYFALKLPEFIVVLAAVAALASVVVLARRARAVERVRDTLVLGTVLVALWGPWIYAVARGSILYDGLRHFLFEVPVLVASVAWASAVGLDQLRARLGPWAPRAAALALALACVDQYATMVRLHPHQYLYFNRSIGGLAGAAGSYDTDYYASSYGEAGAALARELWRREGQDFLDTRYRVASCAGALKTTREMPANFIYDRRHPDLWLGYTRDDCHLRHRDAPVIFEYRRAGAVLVVVRDLRPRDRERAQP